MGSFTDLMKAVWQGPAVQKTYCRIPDDHVLVPGYTSRAFEQDQAYFSISLSEMFLADARRLWQGLAPLTVAVAEFQYAGQKQIVPFVVGKDLLASIEPYLNGDNVEFRNTKILGPCPYTGGDVSLFVGLFQTAASSPATEFFSVLGEIAGAFDLTGLAGYLPAAKALSTGLGRLLGLSGTHLKVGTRDEFTAGEGGLSQFRDGFLAYVNCAKDELAAPLWFKDGSLHSGSTADSTRSVTEYDHCVVRLEWRAERNDYTSLPFHRSWNTTRTLIWANETDKARSSFLDLVQQVAGSPDLTQRHRLGLLAAYRANFQAELETYRATTGDVLPTGANRSAGETRSPKAAFTSDVLAVRDAGFGKDVETTILAVAKAFPAVSGMRSKGADLDDATLTAQMQAIGSSTADPREFAHALMAATFKAGARG